ncbi:hypothetical protein [Streptomyces sp. UNOB3_S3]|uniref:hypothetical protein n=1 Tax=Streptomyces sp. UNOB3_S3 TaxID=2871682 RepID=UPI001E535480|nr:hypothetical protein [Streptomyces sp. UNOB3_S3]MCC3775431.1 hypothetical protein [Streptomyces sp. UNOB3_S3]
MDVQLVDRDELGPTTIKGLQGAGSQNSGGAGLLAELVKAGFAPAIPMSLREATWGDLVRWTEEAALRGDRVPERRLHLPAEAQEQLHELVPENRGGAAPLFEGARWSSHVRKATPGPEA